MTYLFFVIITLLLSTLLSKSYSNSHSKVDNDKNTAPIKYDKK